MTVKSSFFRKLQSLERLIRLPLVKSSKNPLYPSGFCTNHINNYEGADRLTSFLTQIVQERLDKTEPLPGYPFRKSLLTDEDIFNPHSPIMEFCTQKRIMDIARAHLPFEPYLRAVELWVDSADVDRSTPIETQYYHLDGDDTFNLKCFIYLSDVTMEHGPFTFFPVNVRSATSIWNAPAGINNTSRVADESLETSSQKHGVHFTGAKGTMIFADTCWGYHKGLVPKVGKRWLFTFQFTSKRPFWGPVLKLPASHKSELNPAHLQQVLMK